MLNVNQKIAEWLCAKHYLTYRQKKSLVKKLYPEILEDHPFEINFFGMRFLGNSGDHVGRMVYLCGAYEKYMLFFLRDYVESLDDSALTFMDVGANVGNHSLFMSQYVSRILAFEPYEPVRKQLKQNIAVNEIKNISLFPVGLDKKEGEITFYIPPHSNLGIGSFKQEHSNNSLGATKLKVVNGDEELRKHGVETVDIIKIDVEGYERSVIEGLNYTLKNSRPLLVFELSDSTRSEISGYTDFESLFPKNYSFFMFSSANKDTGHYELSRFIYDIEYNIEDVVAVPEEKVIHLRHLRDTG